VVAVYEKKCSGEISFYIFARHKLIYPLAPKQPEISEHNDEIIGAKPARKGLVCYFADLVYAVRIAAKIYHLPLLFCFLKFNSPRFVATHANEILSAKFTRSVV